MISIMSIGLFIINSGLDAINSWLFTLPQRQPIEIIFDFLYEIISITPSPIPYILLKSEPNCFKQNRTGSGCGFFKIVQ